MLSWRVFAYKDVRSLVEQDVLAPTFTRRKEHLSRISKAMEVNRYVLWDTAETGAERALLFLELVADRYNPYIQNLYVYSLSLLELQEAQLKFLARELKRILVDAGYWRVSYRVTTFDLLQDNVKPVIDLLKYAGFYEDNGIAFYDLSVGRPRTAVVLKWTIEGNGHEMAFVPFVGGFVKIIASEEGVYHISFLTAGEKATEPLVLLHASKAGLISDDGVIRAVQPENYRLNYTHTSAAQMQIAEYLAGKRTEFSFKLAEPESTAFQKTVWALLKQIPYAATRSYLDLARELNPSDEARAHKMCRAVGSACGANPLCIVYPCHRVIGSDNSLTGFRDSVKFKAALLDLEWMNAAISIQP